MKRLLVAAAAALAVVFGAAPAFGATVPDRARDDGACAHQSHSPSCQPAGFIPPGGGHGGVDGQHNETLVRDPGLTRKEPS
jgi:hypothetical protein